MMKKLLALLLSLLFAFSLIGCGFSEEAYQELNNMLAEFEEYSEPEYDDTQELTLIEDESSEPQSSKPQSSKPQSSKPQNSKPQNSKPQNSKPQSSKPQSSKPQSSRPQSSKPQSSKPQSSKPQKKTIDENGSYTSRDDVALYIHTYNKLPKNFITKTKAQKLGWQGGSLEPYAPGMSIGGGRFGNYEGVLPEKKGRTYTECDIDTRGKSSRGAKRIVFSNDGLIYYTDDHYETFTLLYGEE